ncbi:OmpA family protein [Swingsia samuiensis]|uniref:OmpA family protein n=1 Tax=Swingsia samuiensis TaxID=1293412 RepID=A0A4Y6UK22_9PROT|nr:OmpA family protein [Swingsia samuiensis]QDH16741.1 OmpA family protein [Swingsia samuiensis]
MKQRSVFRTCLARAGLTASVSMLAIGFAHAQPVQGLYIAGEGGANFKQDQTVRLSPIFPSGKDRYHTGVTGLGSIGWGFGNGFRVEVEGNYRNSRYQGFRSSGNLFSSNVWGHQHNYGAMANALFDMDIGYSWVYPYFGGGIGYGRQKTHTMIEGTNAEFDQITGGTRGGFAYQAMFGLAFPVPWVVGLSATAEYRFYSQVGTTHHSSFAVGEIGGWNTRRNTTEWASGSRDTRTDFNHSLMLGLRYEFNPAPPPPPVVTTTAPPAPSASRQYLVFFDWSSATLSARARAVVAAAAKSSSATQVTHILVNGYTDSSAAHPGVRGQNYNLQLSERRAQSVKAELIRDGVSAGLITTKGFGESNPLVSTKPNTREPQNRRVEIDFQ